MKKLLFALGAAVALAGSAYAQDFVPEAGVEYSFKHKDSEVYLCNLAGQDHAGLMTATKAGKAAYTWTAEASGDGFLLKNGEGKYMYRNGYSTPMGDASKATVYTFKADGDFYRIAMEGTNCVAPDNVGDGQKVYSDKAITFANGLYAIVKTSEITYEAKVKLGTSVVNIMKDNEGENSATFRFTPMNFDGEVTVTATEGFTVDPATVTVVDGEEATVTVKSAAAIGATGTVTLAFGGAALATVEVNVTEPAPTYYIMNIETGLVIGGDTEKSILTELVCDETQKFSKVEVPGTNRWYLIQKSSGLYFRNVDSGSGVMAHYCEYGANPERAEWSFPENGEGVSLKNSKQDRIVIPTKLESGAQLMCYGLSSDAGSKWQLVSTADFVLEPTVEVTDENVQVESNGMSFTTEVRAYGLEEGSFVTVKPSKDVNVSLTTIENGYKRQPLTISTTAKPGTQCKIEFVYGTEVLYTLEFTVNDRYPRYVIRYVSEGVDLAIGSEEGSAQPILKEFNLDDPTQQMIFIPVDENGDGEHTEEEGYNIAQEGSFGFFSYAGNGWDSTFGTNKGEYSLWHLERNEENPELFGLRSVVGLLNVDNVAAGAKLYCNKAAGTWTLQPLGEISCSNYDVVLESRTATELIKVNALGLKEALAVTTTGAATASVTTLPAEGGEFTVGLKADGTETSGTVVLTSGNFSKTIEVRLKATTLVVDKEAVEIVGKRGKAIFNVSATDITEPIAVTTEGEGFAVNVSSIEAGAKVSQDITVTYSGKTEATGKVLLSCAGMTKTVNVSVKFNPDIILNTEEFALEGESAYFSVTAVDLFDPIYVTTDKPEVVVSSPELEADANDAYVFLTVPETMPAGTITITVKSGNIVKTLTLEKTTSGIAAVEADAVSVSVRGGMLCVAGAEAGARVVVADLTGRSTVAPAESPVALGHKGVYLVKVIAADGASQTFKVIL